MGILRLGHVEVRVPDLDLAAAYYTGVIGMVEAEDDLADLENRLERAGAIVRRLEAGEERSVGQGLRFETPSGHVMELYAKAEQVGSMLPRLNPRQPRPDGLAGIAPPRIDHLLVTAEEVGDASHFYMDVLGFRLTEQLLDGDGHQLGVWMERSHTPHDLAVVSGPNGGLHHWAYWLDDWDEIRRAADTLAYHDIAIDVGPTRHGITRGETIYFFDPLGNRNEVFTGGYKPDPDWDVITWTEDQMGRGIFYWEDAINQRFMTLHT